MNLADDFGIENFDAKNIGEDGKQAVKVLVESSEDAVKEFFNYIKEDFPLHSEVDSIDMENHDGRVKSLKSFISGFNSYQLSKIANTGVGMLNTQENMLNTQEKMLDKLDDIKSDTSQIKSDTSKIPDIERSTSKIPDMKKDLGDIKSNTAEMKQTISFGFFRDCYNKKRAGAHEKRHLANKEGIENPFNFQLNAF